MFCITSPSSSNAQAQFDPLQLPSSRGKRAQRLQARKRSLHSLLQWPSQLGIISICRAPGVDPILLCRKSTHRDGALPFLGVSLELGRAACAVHVHMCSSREFGMCGDSASILHIRKKGALGLLGSTHRMSLRTHAFNPLNGGGGGGDGGRTIFNLAGAGLLTYLTITGRLNWLFDAIFTLWLVSTVVWWLAERSLIKGLCPNCGGEFQVFEFSVKDEPRLCPYCSQPFKLENKRFVRDEPQFSSQQRRGFKQPFGGFGSFGGVEDFARQTSARKREDTSGVIVDIEAEVRDKD